MMQKKTGETDYQSTLKIANRLRANAKKAEDLATWMGKTLVVREVKAGEEGKDIVRGGTLYEVIRVAQAERDAGAMHADEALYILHRVAGRIADSVIECDPKMQDLLEKVEAVAMREGRGEDETWRADYPGAPADWKALIVDWDRRADEILGSILRSFGEDEAASLYLAARDEFNRRVNFGWQALRAKSKAFRGNTGSC